MSYPIQNRVKPLYTFFSSNHTIQPTYRPKRTFYLSYRAPRIILHFRNLFRNNTTNIKHYNFFICSQFKSKHSTFSSYFLHSTAIIDDKQFSLQNKQHVAPELICFMIKFFLSINSMRLLTQTILIFNQLTFHALFYDVVDCACLICIGFH